LSGLEPVTTITHAQLDEVLPVADHVINLLPANDATNGFFGASAFARMKPGCYFYNVGRGSTVEQDSLISALRSGQIAGAYLDVTTPEPLPPNHELWSLPNCHITPHTAGGQRNEMVALVEHFLENLTRFTNQQPLINRVA
jgi:phosphoglycerate dehydrogenase-like enzyme